MKQFQIAKHDLTRSRIAESDSANTGAGADEIVVEVQKFGFSANNITYAVMGERLAYWNFFQAIEDTKQQWGVLPVWGFATVVESNVPAIEAGERLFGYFPPAERLVMKPVDIADAHFFDGADHRLPLPKGYNLYRRVAAEPGYNPAQDAMRMLLYPLYVTSFALWDLLSENKWYGAEQTLLLSASSKTSIGLAYALSDDGSAPRTIGLTSKSNLAFVEGLGIYDAAVSYDDIEERVSQSPTVIVDMSGNGELLGRLHTHLGQHMLKTINVGLTHWDGARGNADINRDRSEMFFAPSHIQQRMKDWGAAEFQKRSTAFIMDTSRRSAEWIDLSPVQGLGGLSEVYPDMRDGKVPAERGIVVEL